ncbi:hypothetical protein [Photobacterium galatheae]|uniref:hypothetical protein n=1 Tax=Photobacterium galatheae TaxID=1654360 RepID=UPI001267C058|nr:hypothetical protein [Photobacterium galatheae]MCM0149574.1 hypothetical protein [Photobacterium galatheae]
MEIGAILTDDVSFITLCLLQRDLTGLGVKETKKKSTERKEMARTRISDFMLKTHPDHPTSVLSEPDANDTLSAFFRNLPDFRWLW